MNEQLKTDVFEALGEASMCWNPRPGNLVFDSTHAEKVGNELLIKIQDNLPAAMDVLIKKLGEDDSEGSYYYSWQANIAMSFYDVFIEEGALCDRETHKNKVLESCNKAAKNFLDLLCKPIEYEGK